MQRNEYNSFVRCYVCLTFISQYTKRLEDIQ